MSSWPSDQKSVGSKKTNQDVGPENDSFLKYYGFDLISLLNGRRADFNFPFVYKYFMPLYKPMKISILYVYMCVF